MRQIQASEAKTKFLQLLDDVERGETVVITRRGKSIARLVPETERDRVRIDRAIEGIRAIRKRTARVTVEELISARDEGRKR